MKICTNCKLERPFEQISKNFVTIQICSRYGLKTIFQKVKNLYIDTDILMRYAIYVRRRAIAVAVGDNFFKPPLETRS